MKWKVQTIRANESGVWFPIYIAYDSHDDTDISHELEINHWWVANIYAVSQLIKWETFQQNKYITTFGDIYLNYQFIMNISNRIFVYYSIPTSKWILGYSKRKLPFYLI